MLQGQNINPQRQLKARRIQGENLKITANGISVSYNDYGPGDAPVIIFIHGFPFNKWMWSAQVSALRKNYRVLCYDLRGYGDSDQGDVDFSIDLFVADLVAFMNELAIKKAMICGLSMGGYIALSAIEKHSDRFDALVLCDTQCDADTEKSKQKRLEAIETIREKGVSFYADEMLKHLFAPESYVTRKEEIKAIREMILNTSKPSLYRTLAALMMRKETCSRLSEIKVPVLVMVGEHDEVTPPDKSKYLHDKIYHSFLNFIEHAGHVANMENPEAFNASLKKFASRFAG